MSFQSKEPGSFLPENAISLEREAERYFEYGNLWQALSLERQAMQIWQACDHPEREALSTHIVGYLCFRLNDHPASLAAYSHAANLRSRLEDFSGMALSLARAAEVQQHLGNHRKAIELLTTTLPYWDAKSHRKERGIVLNNLGVSHNALGQRSEARRYYEQALVVRQEMADHEGIAASLHNLGSLCSEEGDRNTARQYLNQAADLRRAMNAKADLGRTLLNLGLLWEHEGDLTQAIDCYEQAWQLAVDPEVSDPNDEAAALHNLGVAAAASGEPSRALRLLQQSQAILTKTGRKHVLASSHHHCGLIYRQLKQPQQALEHLLQAKSLQEEIEDRSGLATTLVATAAVFAEAGVLPPAHDLLVQASALQQELDQDEALLHTLGMLAQICELQGKQEEALRYQRIISPATVAEIVQRVKCMSTLGE